MLINRIVLSYQNTFIWVNSFEELSSWWVSWGFSLGLMILCYFTLNVTKSLIYGSNLSWLMNLNTIYNLWIEVGNGLLILMQRNSSLLHVITQGCYWYKNERLTLHKNFLLRWLKFLFLLNCFFMLCLLLK